MSFGLDGADAVHDWGRPVRLSWQSLPTETTDNILGYLTPEEMLQLRLVDSSSRLLVDSSGYWLARCKKKNRCKMRSLPPTWQAAASPRHHFFAVSHLRAHLAPGSGIIHCCEALDLMRGWDPARQVVTVLALVRHGVHFDDVERKTGRSALHLAASLGNASVVRLLLEMGLPVNRRCRFSSTALHWAVRSDSLATCRVLLTWNRKCDSFEDGTSALPSSAVPGASFQALLGSYTSASSIDQVRTMLLEAGAAVPEKEEVEAEEAGVLAEINVVEEGTRATPVHLAARKERLDMVALLLHLAYVNEERDMSDTMGYKHDRMANRTAKSLVNARTREGSSLMHFLADCGDVELVNWCIQHGGMVELPNNNGHTPLFWAAFADRARVVQLLLLRGADIHGRDRLRGNTPLHTAAYRGHLACVQVLVRDGADVFRTNKEGLSPIALARACNKQQCAAWMVAHAYERYTTAKPRARQSIWLPQIPEFAGDGRARSQTIGQRRAGTVSGSGSTLCVSQDRIPRTKRQRRLSRQPGVRSPDLPFTFQVPRDRPRSQMLSTSFRVSARSLSAPLAEATSDEEDVVAGVESSEEDAGEEPVAGAAIQVLVTTGPALPTADVPQEPLLYPFAAARVGPPTGWRQAPEQESLPPPAPW